MRNKQGNNKYFSPEYISPNRWASFGIQIREIINTHPQTVLEIGKGSGLVNHVLNQMGIDAKTVDIDKSLAPDFVSDIRRLPMKENSFDTVVCFEVLEHLPFSDFLPSLKQLRRVSKKYVLLSLPEPHSTYLSLAFKFLPFLPKVDWFYKISFKEMFFPKLNKNIHLWEINRNPASLSEVLEKIDQAGLKVIKEYCSISNLYHHFFILEKKI